jgi:hypothetical protein
MRYWRVRNHVCGEWHELLTDGGAILAARWQDRWWVEPELPERTAVKR